MSEDQGKDIRFATRLLHTGHEIDPVHGAAAIPIYQTSTYHQDDVENPPLYDYARSGNPSRDALQGQVAALEGGTHALAFSSGMAAITASLMLFSAGDHLIACDDIYGGTYRALTQVFNRMGIETTFVDATDPDRIRAAIRPNTKGLILETPSNPTIRIIDLKAAAQIAREHGLISIVDNTFMTPYLQRPLELGIDVVVHSATKFLGGHSDVVAGLTVTKDEGLGKRLKFLQNATGGILGPQDCFLLQRGLKTLKVRLDASSAGAEKIAKWLRGREDIAHVYYPGLTDHPGHAVHKAQADGYGAVLSFDVGSGERAKRLASRVTLPIYAVSLGAVETILSYPRTMSHAAMPEPERHRRGITDGLLRLSVGLEDPDDLIADLEQGLR
ncbi:aminotransferase class I/II-fold pyridoxal phosphate-dependent enzyme [Tumebacillus sp. DT12]|uniref:cysteine-S-conjugate beta-lyase n=1 Tax=Tumebacillus lacus TaxID=2995335 RepID=A0ABT3X2M4_9BACL|nr:aminotransferase class I/II-fold pyridoxal phosphate-dependent enzyme [Tumebacillus lacus]MCX7568969.1 aminotransferase class I/II-fold pyridoxal phosphate-dependent enzyme [Tumebacillus lacus]